MSRPSGSRPRHVLAVNAGSSSVKLALFEVTGEPGATGGDGSGGSGGSGGDGLGGDGSGGSGGDRLVERWRSQLDVEPGTTPDLARAVDELRDRDLPPPDAVGHRVVHGGPDHVAPARVDDALRADLVELVRFAPLHQPAALAGLAAAERVWPGRPQVACFDTAFHRSLAPEAFTYALPAAVRATGVRRYGFHGLSYEYVVSHLAELHPGRTVIAHLGSGASLCAVAGGRSVDTTMGFTPTGGLVMATRPGDLDPGVLIDLLRRPPGGLGRDGSGPTGPTGLGVADALEDLLDHRSGLAGLSGGNGDARNLLAVRAAGDADAALALSVFTRTAAKQVAAMAAALGGLDTLVFTGGIGQHAPELRAEIAAPLGFLGIAIHPEANRTSAAVISPPGAGSVRAGGVTVRVVATDEERVIARHTAALVYN